MWFFIFLFISNVYATDCVDEEPVDFQHILELQIAYDNYVASLISERISEEKANTLAEYDPEGMQLKHAMSCIDPNDFGPLSNYSGSKNSDTDWIYSVIGIIPISALFSFLIARHTIVHSAKKRDDDIREKGIETMNLALVDVRSTLGKKRDFHDTKTDSIISYVNKKFAITPFESVISSGTFSYLSIPLQKGINNLYFVIQDHNQKLWDLEQLRIKHDTEPFLMRTKHIMIVMMLQLVINESKIQQYSDELGIVLSPQI